MDWYSATDLRFRDYSRKRRDSRDMSWYFAAQSSQLEATRFQLIARGGCYHGQRRRCREILRNIQRLRQHAPTVYEGPPRESFVFQNRCGYSRRDARASEQRASLEQREAHCA